MGFYGPPHTRRVGMVSAAIEAGDAFLAVLWQNNVGITYTPRKLYGHLLVRGRGKAEEQLYGRDHHRCTRGTR
jgi:hypothetical protein